MRRRQPYAAIMTADAMISMSIGNPCQETIIASGNLREAGYALSDHGNTDHQEQDRHDRGVVVDQPSLRLSRGPAIRAEAMR